VSIESTPFWFAGIFLAGCIFGAVTFQIRVDERATKWCRETFDTRAEWDLDHCAIPAEVPRG
jgi:hypothetical protein